jgi:ankyrin repeat protein
MKNIYLLAILLSCSLQATPLNPEVLRSGDVRKLRAALDAGASPSTPDASGTTPLMVVAVYGDLAWLRLLLDRGADLNATNRAGATALMRAAYDFDKVRLLVEKGANVNARSALGNTPLMLAARPARSSRAVKFLLECGADAKATNNFGATALMATIAGGDEDSVRLLIKHGADVNAQPTADELGFILGGGRTPLMWAAYRGNTSIMKRLVDAGANVNIPTGLGTPLTHAAWGDHAAAARLLLDRGADANMAGPLDGYAALHWAASSEQGDAALTKLLLDRGADPNLGGGENVDAFVGTLQTPLMLARRRGDTPILATLVAAGATNATPDRDYSPKPPVRQLPQRLTAAALADAMAHAVVPLQVTSLQSKEAFVRHSKRQDCTSCHQQHLPMAAIGFARKQHVPVDLAAEQKLVTMVKAGAIKDPEVDWQALFHPDAVYTEGYEVFAAAAQDSSLDDTVAAWVHHLAAIQGRDGQWHNNLPRPPIQTDDVGATALAVHALSRYPLPGRKAEFGRQIDRARRWLWTVKPHNHEARVYQLLGLAWAGESPSRLQSLAGALIAQQSSNGAWSQLPGLKPDAYATGQAIYALRVAAKLSPDHSAIERGVRYLLENQLEDGTWHVRRRAFPFQPTMNSGFPHGRDSWISAAATSWAVMALSVSTENKTLLTDAK